MSQQVVFQIESVNMKNYVTGYSVSSKGKELPEILRGVIQWRDEYGNPKWELLGDGSVVPANITPTQEQINERNTRVLMGKAESVLLRTIVEAIKGTTTPAQSWSAIDAALRAKLGT